MSSPIKTHVYSHKRPAPFNGQEAWAGLRTSLRSRVTGYCDEPAYRPAVVAGRVFVCTVEPASRRCFLRPSLAPVWAFASGRMTA